MEEVKVKALLDELMDKYLALFELDKCNEGISMSWMCARDTLLNGIVLLRNLERKGMRTDETV